MKMYNPDDRVVLANETAKPKDNYAIVANDRFKLYTAFIKAGFSEEQAFTLMRDFNVAYANNAFES